MCSYKDTPRGKALRTHTCHCPPFNNGPGNTPHSTPPSPCRRMPLLTATLESLIMTLSPLSPLPSSRISVFWCKLSPDPGSEVRLG